MKGVRKVWRESASLLLLSRNPNQNQVGTKSNFNYEMLVMKRSQGSKFMANAIVFPGGVIEKADSNRNWLDLYSKIGVQDSRLNALRCDRNTDFIYQKATEDEQIERELSLRISAIRETFEEVGILLAKGQEAFQLDNQGLYTTALTGFDIQYWQKEVQGNPGRFYDLCMTLQVVPDVFSLHGWANWMTPTTVGKHRFDTIFYVASLAERPQLAMDQKEVQHVVWTTPSELIDQHKEGSIWLPPPQIYELSKFNQVTDFEQMTKYSQWRSQFGTQLIFPVQYLTKGRLVHVLPGDDLYPKEPNYYDRNEDYDQYEEKTAEELEQISKNLHRTIHESMEKSELLMTIVPAREHLNPLPNTNSFEAIKAKAKL